MNRGAPGTSDEPPPGPAAVGRGLPAAFEFALGRLLSSRGRAVRAGDAGGVVFQVVLAPQGSWWPTNRFLGFGHAHLARYDFDADSLVVVRAGLRHRADASGGPS